MKHLLCCLMALAGIAASVSAQQAWGLRLTMGANTSVELNGQFGFRNNNTHTGKESWLQHLLHKVNESPISERDRIEAGLAFGSTMHRELGTVNYATFVGTYQWHQSITKKIGWYAGPSACLSLCQHYEGSALGLGIGAQVGADMMLPFHLLQSADFRPLFRLSGPTTGPGWGVAIGLRYMIEPKTEAPTSRMIDKALDWLKK